jgi:hypothetical protein
LTLKSQKVHAESIDHPHRAITNMSIVSVLPDQVSSQLGDEAVILNVKTGTYFGLNEVGTRIWSLIQEPVPVEKVIQTLLDEYEVDPKQCEEDILNLIDDLSNAALIEVKDGSSSKISAS